MFRAAHLLAALLLGAALPSWSAEKPVPPPPEYYVLDEPNALDAGSKRALQELLVEHDRLTGQQIVFAVFSGLDDQDLVGWTTKVFGAWKIGRRGKDDGALLAVYWKDHKAQIEVGYGLEGELTDAKSKRIIEDDLVPEMKAGNPGRALELTAYAMLTAVGSPLIENGRAQAILRSGGFRGDWAPSGSTGMQNGWVVWVFLGFILLSIVWNFLTAADAHFTGGGWYRPNPWRRIRRRSIFWGGGGWGGGWGAGGGWGGSGGGFGGWGGGGGGGFSGGGGMTGGGGASGSW